MRMQMTFVLIATLVSAGFAASAQAAVVEKDVFIGKNAGTSFSGTATITCADGSQGTVSALGFLSGSEQISKQTGTPKTFSNGVFVEIDSYFNDCTGASLGFSDAGIANGFTPPNKRLNSAGLEGTALVQDFDTGAKIPVVIDIVIQGTGPLSAGRSSSKNKTLHPLTITISKSSNANRAGVASGTISIDGVPLDTTFSATTLSDNASFELTIEKK